MLSHHSGPTKPVKGCQPKSCQASGFLQRPIPNALLEGAVRKLVVLAELASVTFYAFDEGDRQLLDGLHEVATEVRSRLEQRVEEVPK